MRISCPLCRHILNVSRAAAGHIGNCPNCGQRMRVPGGRTTMAAPYAQGQQTTLAVVPRTAVLVAAELPQRVPLAMRFWRYLMSWIIWPAPVDETPGESWVRTGCNLFFVLGLPFQILFMLAVFILCSGIFR